MAGIIKILKSLFTEHAIFLSAEEFPENNLYARLNWFYQNYSLPAIKECMQHEAGDWKKIALATKEYAIQLINRLSFYKSPAELIQIILFQRALLGKKPYCLQANHFKTDAIALNLNNANNKDFNDVDQPLTTFLVEIIKRQKIQLKPGIDKFPFIEEKPISLDLGSFWIPYSILFKQFTSDNYNLASNPEFLELLTATAVEEPDQLLTKLLMSYINQLSENEIITFFQHKKFSLTDFQIIFEAIFGKNNDNPDYSAKLPLSNLQLFKILSYQPQSWLYFFEKNNAELNHYLQRLTSDQIVEILVKKQNKSDAEETYYYSEQEFYFVFTLICQHNTIFIQELSSKNSVDLFCRLELSGTNAQTEKNQNNKAIFSNIKLIEKLSSSAEEHWFSLLIHAKPAVISKLMTIPECKKTLADVIKDLTKDNLQALFEIKLAEENLGKRKKFPLATTLISEKLFSVIYRYFNLNKLTNPQKAILITALAKNFTNHSFEFCVQIISTTGFLFEDINFIVNNLSKKDSQSISLLGILFENFYMILFRENLFMLFWQGSIETVMALLCHKNKSVKEHVFDKLTIFDFAKISVIKNYQNEIKKLLEFGLFEKINLTRKNISNSIKNEISQALWVLLDYKSGAKNNHIFNFIYHNKKFRFIEYANNNHLVKTFSNQLNSNDTEEKTNLVQTESNLISNLKKEHILEIFFNVQRNHYVLPNIVSNDLTITLLGYCDNFIDRFNDFLKTDYFFSHHHDKNLYTLDEIDLVKYNIMLDIHKINSIIYPYHVENLINYFQENHHVFMDMLIKQGQHNHIVPFIMDKKIADLINPADVVKVFLVAEQKQQSFSTEFKQQISTYLLNPVENLAKQLTQLFDNEIHKSEYAVTNQLAEKIKAELILLIYQHIYQKNFIKHQQLIQHLTEANLKNLVRLVFYQNENIQLTRLFQDNLLLAELNSNLAKLLLTTQFILPLEVAKTLAIYLFKSSKSSLENLLLHDSENYNDKIQCAILLAVFLQYGLDLNSNECMQLKQFFTNHPDEIINILLSGANKPDFNFDISNLLKLSRHKEIKTILAMPENQDLLLRLFIDLPNSKLNTESQLAIANEFIAVVSRETTVKIFTATSVNNCPLSIEIQKCLVEKLNFKKLPRLIQKNTLDSESLNKTLTNICASQIERQKEFSTPAFMCSLLYGVFYYPTVGWLLSFIEPETSPFYLYKALKLYFQPNKVIKMKKKAFEQKRYLAQIADKALAEEELDTIDSSLIINQPPNSRKIKNGSYPRMLKNMKNHENDDAETLLDAETGEIKPFTHPSGEYVYLFPVKKALLDLKAAAAEEKLQSIQNDIVAFNESTIIGHQQDLIFSKEEKQNIHHVIDNIIKGNKNPNKNNYNSSLESLSL